MDPVWTGSQWKGQRIENGLPIITTTLEKNHQLCEMEQFASPLGDLDAAIRGYLPSVFFTSISLSGKPGPVDFAIHYNNEMGDLQMEIKEFDGGWSLVEKETGNILLIVETKDGFCSNE